MMEIHGYTLKAKIFDVETGKNIVVLNEEEAHEMDMLMGDRVLLTKGDKRCIAIVDLSTTLVKRGEMALFSDTSQGIGAKHGEMIGVSITSNPASVEIIKRKMDGGILKNEEIKTVIDEIMENKLSETEL